MYTSPSEQYGTPAMYPLLCGPTPDAPLSHFSLSSSSDPYPAWHALCFIWPAGLLNKQSPPHPHTPPVYHKSTEIQLHHPKSHLQHVLLETTESNWARFWSWQQPVFPSLQPCFWVGSVLQHYCPLGNKHPLMTAERLSCKKQMPILLLFKTFFFPFQCSCWLLQSLLLSKLSRMT